MRIGLFEINLCSKNSSFRRINEYKYQSGGAFKLAPKVYFSYDCMQGTKTAVPIFPHAQSQKTHVSSKCICTVILKIMNRRETKGMRSLPGLGGTASDSSNCTRSTSTFLICMYRGDVCRSFITFLMNPT